MLWKVLSEGLFKGIFSGVVLALSMQVCIVGATSEDADDDTFSDAPDTMSMWLEGGGDSSLDGQLTSLQLGPGSSLGAAPTSLYPHVSGEHSSLFNFKPVGNALPVAPPNISLDKKVLPSFAREPVSRSAPHVINDSALKNSYPHIHWSITNPMGKYINQPEEFSKYLLTVLVLEGLNTFLDGKRKRVEAEHRNKTEKMADDLEKKMNEVKRFGRSLFMTSLIGLLPTANTRENCLALLKKMWNLYSNQWDTGKYKASALSTVSDTLYTNPNYKPFLNTVSQLMREYGPEMMSVLGFIKDNPMLESFASQFPVTYSVIQLSQNGKYRKWWLKHYQSREMALIVTDSNIEGLEQSIGKRSAPWPYLKKAVVKVIAPYFPVTMSTENIVNALFHALLRQRYAMFEWRRNFLPGSWGALTDEELHIEKLLEGNSGSATVSDKKVEAILDALNREAAHQYREEIAAKAFFMLLEAPLAIYPVSTSLGRFLLPERESEIFKVLSEIPQKEQEANYTDLIYQDWVLIELATGRDVIDEGGLWGLHNADDAIKKHISQITLRFGESDDNKLIRKVSSLSMQQRRKFGHANPVTPELDHAQWQVALGDAAIFLLPGLHLSPSK